MIEGKLDLVDNSYYDYNGAGNIGSRIYMGSFVFVKSNQ